MFDSHIMNGVLQVSFKAGYEVSQAQAIQQLTFRRFLLLLTARRQRWKLQLRITYRA
jgi:hypothetical protein